MFSVQYSEFRVECLEFRPRVCCQLADFVDFDLIDRIVDVSPCHPQARTGTHSHLAEFIKGVLEIGDPWH